MRSSPIVGDMIALLDARQCTSMGTNRGLVVPGWRDQALPVRDRHRGEVLSGHGPSRQEALRERPRQGTGRRQADAPRLRRGREWARAAWGYYPAVSHLWSSGAVLTRALQSGVGAECGIQLLNKKRGCRSGIRLFRQFVGTARARQSVGSTSSTVGPERPVGSSTAAAA